MAEGTRWQDIFNNLQKHDGQFEDLNQLCGSLQQRVEGLEGFVNEVKKDIKSLLEGFHKKPKIEFPRFNGSDPRGRVRKSEEYFEFCPMEIERMVRVLLMHFKCEMMLDARLLFDEMPERNMVSWNTIIVGLLDSVYYIEAIRMFLSMCEVFSDDDSRTFALMTRACAALEDIFLGEQLHTCALKMHLDADASVSCALIDMYSKCGCIEDAKCVFDKMPKKSTAGWNSIIAGYALHGSSQEFFFYYIALGQNTIKI